MNTDKMKGKENKGKKEGDEEEKETLVKANKLHETQCTCSEISKSHQIHVLTVFAF